VKSVAKSVARYTYQRFSPTGFSAWQAVQGAKGGKKSRGGGRPSKRDELMPVIQERLEQEWTKTRIATELNITTRTLQNWLSDSKPEKTSHIR
jgi:DNA invertase Pin-like site-specific DNA recombinase